MKQKISITIENSVLKGIDSVVDNVFIRNRSQAVEFLAKSALGEHKQAVILAGGPEEKLRISGTEYRITARVGSSTVIERAVKKLRENGFRDIYVVARHNILTKVFDVLKDGSGYNVKVSYIEEKESEGSADSLRLLKGKISTNFLAVYGHIIFDKVNVQELWSQHIKQGTAVATLLLTTAPNPSEKGTVKVEGSRILEFVQKPKKTEVYLVFSPIFVATPEIFNTEGGSLEYDVFPKLAEQGLLYGHASSEKEQHVHTAKDVHALKNSKK
ncbi:MAG TPA: sugar phosphate nucleotidyltransferase [Candidatus Nanoarchaeia archaeon]|nr:sugar phosphate nucleotidyltransferase [Candidatus Nanoarchaeia archaeon]